MHASTAFVLLAPLLAPSRASTQAAGASTPDAGRPATVASAPVETARVQAAAGAPALGPRQAIDGIQALEVCATLTYDAAPSRPHALRISYAFPDRARLYMPNGPVEGPADRRLRYRHGEIVWALEPRQAQSVEYKAEDRAALLLSFEARRALYLWPHGFAWTTPLEGGDKPRDGLREARLAGLGMLRVELDPHGRPARLDALGTDGGAGESWRAIAWESRDGRWIPAGHEIWLGDKRVWTERVTNWDRQARLLDAFFLPADRRPAPPAGVQHLDLPAHRSRRVALPKDATLASVPAIFEREVASRAEEMTALGTSIEPKVTVELDEELRPTHLVLRLAGLPLKPAPDWIAVPERSGYALVSRTLPEGRQALERLRSAAHKDQPLGRPYLRHDLKDPASFVLVLPIDP